MRTVAKLLLAVCCWTVVGDPFLLVWLHCVPSLMGGRKKQEDF